MKVKELPVSIYYSLKLRYGTNGAGQKRSKTVIPVLISLTTIESRLGVVDLVIRSLLSQSVSPVKILLWIPDSLEKELPPRLTELCGDIFEIRTTHLHCSHKKLIHTLSAFPEYPVITCDDDLMYRPQWLSLLYEESQRFPGAIIANQTRTIKMDREGNFLPYGQWPTDQPAAVGSDWVLPIGAEGVLYPPASLDKRFDKEDLFLNLAPKADDLWFKTMSLLKGTKCRLASNRSKKAVPVMGSQKTSLKHVNIKKDLNSVQWLKLSDHFNLKDKLKSD
ncbi:zinc-binding alcohol dehydrogenase [Muriicola sp. SD30]|uniref:zinc-binding alcohol dehydrogenase n=1 Tax=Muriicola sp. SD30 TaxID=3240936 RepID=UPI00351075CB